MLPVSIPIPETGRDPNSLSEFTQALCYRLTYHKVPSEIQRCPSILWAREEQVRPIFVCLQTHLAVDTGEASARRSFQPLLREQFGSHVPSAQLQGPLVDEGPCHQPFQATSLRSECAACTVQYLGYLMLPPETGEEAMPFPRLFPFQKQVTYRS